MSFIQNWVQKKAHGQYCRADAQACALAVLYSNRLGAKTYSELAPIVALPGVRPAQRLKQKQCEVEHYMPGINQWAIRKAASHEFRPLQNGMDGTRVICAIELYHDMLIGEQFPADVRKYPKELPKPQTPEDLKQYIFNVREKGLYAAEAYSLNLSDTTGLPNDIVKGVIPEATKGITGAHLFSLMMEVEKHRVSHITLDSPLYRFC